MKKYLIMNTVALIIATVFFYACSDSTNGYIESNNGVLIRFIEKGQDSLKAVQNEIVTVKLIYRIGDSIIFNSNDVDDGTISFPITTPIFKGDLYDALTLLGAGDSASVAVVADSFFLKTAAMKRLPKSVEPGSKVYYDLRLISHETQEKYQQRLQEEAIKKSKEEKVILQTYLNENKIFTDPTKTGLYFLEEKEGRGSTPDTGEMCQVFFSVKVLNSDDVLYSNFNGEAFDFEFGGTFDTKGFQEGVGLMKPGGKAKLLVPSWIGVGSTGIEVVPPFTTLEYDVELVAIRSVDEVNKERKEKEKRAEIEKIILKSNEPQRIAEYLANNKPVLDSTNSGLYFEYITNGSGPRPVDGDIVTLHYIMYDMNNNVLQSSYDDNTPFTYEVGTSSVIKGWEEAVKLMPKGSKSWMLIPSKLGYGEHQRVRNIKPYSPLIFELEIINIQ